MKPIIIGIAGGSASGKTSVASTIKSSFEGSKSVTILRQDDYYRVQDGMPMEERVKTNYDHPLAIETELLISHLKDLLQGQNVKKPTYDFVNHTRSQMCDLIEPCDVIILEGLFVLENVELRELLDIKIFVDTDADIRFIRRLKRDVEDRGRTLDSVIEQYIKTVRVMHDLFIEPSKRYADLIIPEGGRNKVAVDLLITKISSIIKANML
ncbi:MAG: uridine kinase [Anaerorhabdus sp.]